MPAKRQTQLDRLLRLLNLERLDDDLFLGDPGKGPGRLFGGLVTAQCVVAAYRTVDEGSIHSLHAYYLRPGSYDKPIRYVNYRIRDGRTFTTRDVVAYQGGEAIFQMSCSFARPEEGITSQAAAPKAPGPDGLPDWEIVRPENKQAADIVRRWRRERPVEMRFVAPDESDGDRPHRQVWAKPRGELPEDESVHAGVIAYASDMGLISTARYAHGTPNVFDQSLNASLDHTVWFHRPPRFDDWLLFTSWSPIMHAARALIHGTMHDQQGRHVASVAQEGLLRSARKKPPVQRGTRAASKR
jgi:acyl-CoA thioesterase-2